MSRAYCSLRSWSRTAGAIQDLGALGRGREAPGREGLLCGGYGVGHILRAGGGKLAHDVGVVGGVHICKRFAGRRGDPLAADQIAIFVPGHFEDL